MDLFCESLTQAYCDIFELFALGGNRQSTFKRCFLIAFNIAIPLIFLVQYLTEENIFISVDPLSQSTDLFELFTPLMITSYVILKYFRMRKTHAKIVSFMEEVDGSLSKTQSFVKIKNQSALIYTMKFVAIHAVGIGFDGFMMIT